MHTYVEDPLQRHGTRGKIVQEMWEIKKSQIDSTKWLFINYLKKEIVKSVTPRGV